MDRVARSVFVHGSGRSGPAAWPEQLTIPGSTFLVRPGFGEGSEPVRTNFEREADLVNKACGDGAHVVASSFGTIAAIGAAGIKETGVRSLVLIEPAAFSLGRHLPAVEAHIDAVAPVIRAAQR